MLHHFTPLTTMSLGRRRNQLPRTLITIALPDGVLARIRQIVGDAAQVTPVATLRAATDALGSSVGNCLIVAVPSENAAGLLTAYEQFRGLYPHVPVVALFLQGVSAHRGTLEMGRIGVSELLSVDGALDADAFCVVLGRCHADGVSHHVWKECRPHLADALVTLLKAALRNAHQPMTASGLATAAGLRERSLRQYCEDVCIPSPQWIIGWARLLMAGHFLDEPGRTIAQVAELLRYPSSCALRNQIRRYTGLSPRQLRAMGSTKNLCKILEQVAQRHAAEVSRKQSPAVLHLVKGMQHGVESRARLTPRVASWSATPTED